MKDFLVATGNAHKLIEIQQIIDAAGYKFTARGLKDFPAIVIPPEDGDTFAANAIIKAKAAAEQSGLIAIADDSGLEVDALDCRPGVYSARYAGEDKDFNRNMDKVLYELSALETSANMAAAYGLKTKPVSRRARFKSVVTLIIGGEKHMFEGTLEGVIAYEKSGNGGFGYDPIFIADEYPGQTLADITEEQKNAISHRGKALRAMAAWLQNNRI
jgi:XTP/dITP diphosphohydrolase